MLEQNRGNVPGGALVHHVLVVENDSASAQFLKSFLERQGFDVTCAKDGGQAHSAIVMRRPDFIIMELILPGETGFEICERIKSRERSLPVLILTSIELEDARDLALRVGADGYVTKPYDPDLLVSMIKGVADEVWKKTHLVDPPKDHGYVRFHCRCGKKLKVNDVHRGKTMTCPECGEVLLVPRHD